MSQKLCAVSVDLDPLRCYYAIHGLGETPASLRDVVLRKALPRFAEVFARHGIASTLFVVGSDIDQRGSTGRSELQQLAQGGHELANHSQSHFYDLARKSESEIDAEIGGAEAPIAELAGRRVIGFRAPGYDVSKPMLAVLRKRGYAYDSSVFPSWPYYLAKAGVMGLMSLVGKPSHSVLGDPRALVSPVEPYRPGASPFSRAKGADARDLVELPITVSRGLRLPGIGTAILTAPQRLRILLLDQLRVRSFFNFELHGLDLLDAEADGIPATLVARQPDLRVPVADKVRAFSATLDRLRLDYRFATLTEVAATVA